MENDKSFRKGIKPKKGQPLINLVGQRYGRLVVLEQAESHKGRIAWLCQCDCGNTKIVSGKQLRNGITSSCGCYRKEVATDRATKHKLCGTSLYHVYWNMKKRCYNESCDHYQWYGKEGKTICDEWLEKDGFSNFVDWALANGYKKGLQIDRIDNSVGYSPENCRWVTPSKNCRNKRNNHYITIQDETKTLSDWCDLYNVSFSLVSSRLSRGWDPLKALTTPKLKERKIKDGN